jgi:hypothetical protein
VRLRYPLERIVDGLLWNGGPMEPATAFAKAIGGEVLLTDQPSGPPYAQWKAEHRPTWQLWDRDMLYVAPWWIAWLYRWLPHSIAWHGREYDGIDQAPFFLWNVAAAKWSVGWLPARRRPLLHARFGMLRIGQRTLVL